LPRIGWGFNTAGPPQGRAPYLIASRIPPGRVGFVDSSIRRFVDSSIRRFVDSSIRRIVDSSLRRFVDSSIRRFVASSIR
jgi:hypothetical protein